MRSLLTRSLVVVLAIGLLGLIPTADAQDPNSRYPLRISGSLGSHEGLSSVRIEGDRIQVTHFGAGIAAYWSGTISGGSVTVDRLRYAIGDEAFTQDDLAGGPESGRASMRDRQDGIQLRASWRFGEHTINERVDVDLSRGREPASTGEGNTGEGGTEPGQGEGTDPGEGSTDPGEGSTDPEDPPATEEEVTFTFQAKAETDSRYSSRRVEVSRGDVVEYRIVTRPEGKESEVTVTYEGRQVGTGPDGAFEYRAGDEVVATHPEAGSRTIDLVTAPLDVRAVSDADPEGGAEGTIDGEGKVVSSGTLTVTRGDKVTFTLDPAESVPARFEHAETTVSGSLTSGMTWDTSNDAIPAGEWKIIASRNGARATEPVITIVIEEPFDGKIEIVEDRLPLFPGETTTSENHLTLRIEQGSGEPIELSEIEIVEKTADGGEELLDMGETKILERTRSDRGEATTVRVQVKAAEDTEGGTTELAVRTGSEEHDTAEIAIGELKVTIHKAPEAYFSGSKGSFWIVFTVEGTEGTGEGAFKFESIEYRFSAEGQTFEGTLSGGDLDSDRFLLARDGENRFALFVAPSEMASFAPGASLPAGGGDMTRLRHEDVTLSLEVKGAFVESGNESSRQLLEGSSQTGVSNEYEVALVWGKNMPVVDMGLDVSGEDLSIVEEGRGFLISKTNSTGTWKASFDRASPGAPLWDTRSYGRMLREGPRWGRSGDKKRWLSLNGFFAINPTVSSGPHGLMSSLLINAESDLNGEGSIFFDIEMAVVRGDVGGHVLGTYFGVANPYITRDSDSWSRFEDYLRTENDDKPATLTLNKRPRWEYENDIKQVMEGMGQAERAFRLAVTIVYRIASIIPGPTAKTIKVITTVIRALFEIKDFVQMMSGLPSGSFDMKKFPLEYNGSTGAFKTRMYSTSSSTGLDLESPVRQEGEYPPASQNFDRYADSRHTHDERIEEPDYNFFPNRVYLYAMHSSVGAWGATHDPGFWFSDERPATASMVMFFEGDLTYNLIWK